MYLYCIDIYITLHFYLDCTHDKLVVFFAVIILLQFNLYHKTNHVKCIDFCSIIPLRTSNVLWYFHYRYNGKHYSYIRGVVIIIMNKTSLSAEKKQEFSRGNSILPTHCTCISRILYYLRRINFYTKPISRFVAKFIFTQTFNEERCRSLNFQAKISLLNSLNISLITLKLQMAYIRARDCFAPENVSDQ